VKIDPNGIEYVQTGDCMIIAVYQDGEVRPLTYPQVSYLEQKAIKIMKDGLHDRKDLKQLLFSVKIILRENRYKSNTPLGYGVLNGEQEAQLFLEYGRVNNINLKHLILITDGLFWPKELVSHTDCYWKKNVDLILSRGLEQYTRDLCQLEEQDPDCIKYPRFKKSDDKTGMVISFRNR
jgi:hypothetical protein